MSKKNHNKDTYSRQVSVGDYTFHFTEANTQAYVYALKDGENPAFIMFVNVTDKSGTVVADYERVWADSVNFSNIYSFIDKFLQDSKYRVKFQTGGEPIKVELPKPDEIIKPQCAAAIQRINSTRPDKLRFRDFAGLKTYGRDKVSSMKMDALKDIVTKEEFELITGSVNESDVLSVLRWVRRGLYLDHAIHKVRVDREIANNAR